MTGITGEKGATRQLSFVVVVMIAMLLTTADQYSFFLAAVIISTARDGREREYI